MRKYLFCLFITISVLLTTGCDQAPSTTPLIIPPSTTEPPATTAPETPAETTPQTPANTTPENPVVTTPITTPVTPQQQYVWLCVREELLQNYDMGNSHFESEGISTITYDYYRSKTDYKKRKQTNSNGTITQNGTSSNITSESTEITTANGNNAETIKNARVNQNGSIREENYTISNSFVPETNGLIILSRESSFSTYPSFTWTLDNVENDESGSTYKIISSDTSYALYKINNGKMVYAKNYSTSNGEPQLITEITYSDPSDSLLQEIGIQNYVCTGQLPFEYTYTVSSSTEDEAIIVEHYNGGVYKTYKYKKMQYPFEN